MFINDHPLEINKVDFQIYISGLNQKISNSIVLLKHDLQRISIWPSKSQVVIYSSTIMCNLFRLWCLAPSTPKSLRKKLVIMLCIVYAIYIVEGALTL